MPNLNTRFQLLAGSFLLIQLCGAAYAGRPLTVDDADVDEQGSGHVEGWYARQPGRAHTWTLAPSYSPLTGLELGAAVSRDRTARETATQLQAKLRITPVQESGCNLAAVAGVTRVQAAGSSPYLYGIATCNTAWGATHANLGAVRPTGSSSLGTWGIAHERKFGAFTAHVEAFGQRFSKPTFQVGARTLLADNFQIDGTVGRTGGETLFSVGAKFSF